MPLPLWQSSILPLVPWRQNRWGTSLRFRHRHTFSNRSFHRHRYSNRHWYLKWLDAVDSTGEDTIEALIFDSDAQDITGIWEVADDVDFTLGTDGDWDFNYDESVDNQLLVTTVNTAAVATTDPMFEILTDFGTANGTNMTADQRVFGVSKGTQASNSALFTIDEDGDGVFLGTLAASNLSGTNTGDQTTVSGNAGTATALATPRTIGGVSFDGTANITVSSATGNFAITGTLDANGQVDLGDGGDAIVIDGTALTLQTTGAGSDITLNAVDQIILTDFANCTALETSSGVLTCGSDDGGGVHHHHRCGHH